MSITALLLNLSNPGYQFDQSMVLHNSINEKLHADSAMADQKVRVHSSV
jgi:hypothetical protein